MVPKVLLTIKSRSTLIYNSLFNSLLVKRATGLKEKYFFQNLR